MNRVYVDETIIVVPVNRTSAQGRSNYTYKNIGTGQVHNASRVAARDSKAILQFKVKNDGKTLNTGLDELVINPYYNKTLSEIPDSNKPSGEWLSNYEDLKREELISLQTLFEALDGVDKGTYKSVKNRPLMNQPFKKDVENSYTESFKGIFYYDTNVISNATSRGRFLIQLCKNHPEIALSKDTVNNSIHRFYISTIDEEAQNKLAQRKFIRKALANLNEIEQKYSSFIAYEIAYILGVVKGEVNSETVLIEIDSYIDTQKKNKFGTQIERIETFNNLYTILNESGGKDQIYVRYIVENAIDRRIIVVDNRKYKWLSQKGVKNVFDQGYDKEKMINFFLNQFSDYDEDLEDTNWWEELEKEVLEKGIVKE